MINIILYDLQFFNSSNHKKYYSQIRVVWRYSYWSQLMKWIMYFAFWVIPFVRISYRIQNIQSLLQVLFTYWNIFHLWCPMPQCLSLKPGTHVCPPQCFLCTTKTVTSILWEKCIVCRRYYKLFAAYKKGDII